MREIVWLIVLALLVYVVYLLYQVSRLDKRPKPTPSDSSEDSLAAGDKAAVADTFQLELEVQQLRRDIAQLRLEQDEQRRFGQVVDERLAALKAQLDSAVLAPGTAPEYSEALVFARRGLGVDAIAERCGISVAEAELVRSLAQGAGQADAERKP